MSEPATSLLSRRMTDYWKGVAIVAVVVNHYAFSFFHGAWTYSNGLMTIFFLFSGAGIYLSLERDISPNGTNLARYFWRRATRIFPLYWLAYAIFVGELIYLDNPSGFGLSGFIMALIGAPTHPRSIFWFVTAILECYLLAPVLFLIIRKAGTVSALGLALMAMGFMVLLTFLLNGLTGETLAIEMISYKYVLFGNVILFFLGMLIPSMTRSVHGRLSGNAALLGMAVPFVLLVYATDVRGRYFSGSEIFLAPFLLLSAFCFCLLAAAAVRRLPLAGIIQPLGKNSYPIYLFHQSFFVALVIAGVIEDYSYASIAMTLLLFPVFVAGCFAIQSLAARVQMRSGDPEGQMGQLAEASVPAD